MKEKFRGWRRAAALLAVASVTLTAGVVSPPPAVAADSSVSVSLTPIAPEGGDPNDVHTLSGVAQAFRVAWQCSGANAGTCDNGRIEIPVPSAQPSNVPLAVQQIGDLSVEGQKFPGVLEGSAPNQTLVWTFPAQTPTGVGDSFTFTVLPPNSVTPDGSTIDPVATFTTSNADSATSTATVTVDANIDLEVRKYKVAPAEIVPWLDQNVTYQILAGYKDQFSPDQAQKNFVKDPATVCQENGTWAMQNLVVVDTLMPGVVFVEATNGGSYDPAANTVTWNLGDSVSLNAKTGQYECNASYPNNLRVTVKYPKPTFEGNQDSNYVINNVNATVNAWSQADNVLNADASVSHGLKDSGEGEFNVSKGANYSFAANQEEFQTYRGASREELYSLHVGATSGAAAGRWTMTDMLPCQFTSPTSKADIGCDTPAFTDLYFSADKYLPEIELNWTTNMNRSGICRIPAGSSELSPERFCDGLPMDQYGKPAGGIDMADGEWITRISLDTVLPPLAAGKLYIRGTVNTDLPVSSAGIDYDYSGARNTATHPQWVIVENCTLDNTVTTSTHQVSTNGRPVDPDSRGRCGYRRVALSPVNLEPEKRMFDPKIPANERPENPNVQPGGTLRVQLQGSREYWETTDEQIEAATFTPTFTDYLPANLEFIPDSLVILNPEQVEGLGAPVLSVEDVQIAGQPRQKVSVTFPDSSLGVNHGGKNQRIRLYFDVLVKEGTAAAKYTNTFLLEAAETETSLLDCFWGQMVDESGAATSEQAAAVGCATQVEYNVLPVPAVNAEKAVKGVYDQEFQKVQYVNEPQEAGQLPVRKVVPGIGHTDAQGTATYRVPVKNTGSVAINKVVVYDMLPRIGDTAIKPGAAPPARGSEFNVYLTGPVTGLPAGATALYSTANNPCRGELAGNGGGERSSAPLDCNNSWSSTPANWGAVTGIRVDFGGMNFAAGETKTFELVVEGRGPDGDLTGIAWNNVAIAASEASSATPLLPTEAIKVGLILSPDLTWSKVDGNDESLLLAGSEWTLTPVLAEGESMPEGFPKVITDCITDPCTGEDIDPAPGKFKLSGIPWGDYTLTETTAPDGYELPDNPSHRITISKDHLGTKDWLVDFGKILNWKPGGQLTWQKVDPLGLALAGSEWQLTPYDDFGELDSTKTLVITDCVGGDAGVCAGADQDPVAGKFLIKPLTVGSYQLVETKAPVGFVKLKDPIDIELNGDLAFGGIVNEQSSVPPLPLTGGIGTSTVYIAGAGALVLMLLLGLIQQRRRRLPLSA